MDNAQLNIVSEGIETLKHALAIAFSHHGKAVSWSIIDNTLVFFWIDPARDAMTEQRCTIEWTERAFVKELDAKYEARQRMSKSVTFKSVPFIMPIDADEAAGLATVWLANGAKWDKEPDHDGDNGKGWRVFNGAWGHVYGMYQGICAVAPEWAMYGK